MPARCASLLTVSISHSSVLDDGASITRAPVDHFAIGLLINSEMMEPVKPTTSENTSSIGRFRPACEMKRSTPSSDRTTDITAMTAIFVAMNRKIRFIQ
ncbi:hypothetical protein D3C81_1656940 [compost metagenome]